MKRALRALCIAGLLLVPAAPAAAQTFASGSTGANGAFPPAILPADTTSMTLDLATGVVTFQPGGTTATIASTPAGGFTDGVMHFTTVDVPIGVTLRFARNPANTPVAILAQGDVTIDGTIDVSGSSGSAPGTSLGGTAGPGGFKGGNGQVFRAVGYGGKGLGPGGGGGGGGNVGSCCGGYCGGGGGGGFGGGGGTDGNGTAVGGPTYGALALLPFIGGSGGGGGTANLYAAVSGGGGGGGGGAILIASSGTIRVSGQILANGGAGGGQGGGGGSGGAVRLVATAIAGNGSISTSGGAGAGSVWGGQGGCNQVQIHTAGAGGGGRVRLEAYTLTLPGTNAIGVVSTGAPRQIFMPNAPSIRIVSVNGIPVSPTPAGAFGGVDVELAAPGTFPVVIAASRVPVNTTVSVTAKPETGAAGIGPITTGGLVGTPDSSTVTVDLTFPSSGVYFIEARATFALP